MTPKQFEAIQNKINLKTPELAIRLLVSVRSVERWRAGSVPVPGPVAVLMEMWEAGL